MRLITKVIGGTANASLNNVALVSTDPNMGGGFFSISNVLTLKLQDLIVADCSASVKVSGAATLGVVTFTATTAATNTDYSFWLNQVPNGGKLEGIPQQPVYIIVNTQGVVNPTPTTIATQVAAAVNAAQGLDVTTSGTTTCIITATTVNPELTVGGINTPGNQTLVQTTAAVESFGTFQYMTNQYAINSGTGVGSFPQTPVFIGTPISGKTYSYIKLVYKQINASNNTSDVFFQRYDLWIDEGDAVYAQWVLNYNKEMANLQATNYLINKIPAASAVNATATVTSLQLLGGLITSTSAAAVTATLPTVALLVSTLATLGITVAQGYSVDFTIDNTAGANTVTVALGAGMTAAKEVSSGDTAVDILLTVAATAAGGVGVFRVYFTSATVATLFRLS